MRRLRGRGSLTFILKRNTPGIVSDAMSLKICSLVAIALGSVILFYITLPDSKQAIPSGATKRSKIHYRRVVENDGFPDIVYFRNPEIDGSDGFKGVYHRRSGRRLLTKGLLRPELAIVNDNIESLRRSKRDYISETQQHYSEYLKLHSSDPGRIQTVTDIRGNDIKSADIDEQDTKEEPDVPVTEHGEFYPGRNHEGVSEMELLYLNAVEICEANNATNSSFHGDNNTSSHDDNTSSHDDGHGGKCAAEMASGVPGLWVVLYVAIILFLFIGLAIICDDFFIASLEAISERLKLSEDVAGATFMAAGSSAPELFISIAGAGAGSDVGVGTIVGSAVFNLLIIIALTAALAGKVLCLDWRPFVRDSMFYSLSILAFIGFSMDAQFHFWESLLLLALYVLYIVVMKFNSQLMECMAKWKCCSCFESRVSPESSEYSTDTTPKTATVRTTTVVQPSSSTSTNSTVSPGVNGPSRQVPTPADATPPRPSRTRRSQDSAPTSQSTASPSTLHPTTSKLDPTVSSKTPKKKATSNGVSGTCTCGATDMTSQPQICTCCVIHISSRPCLSCSPVTNLRMQGVPRIRCSACSSISEDVLVVTNPGPEGDNKSASTTKDYEDGGRNTYLPSLVDNGLQEERSASTVKTIRSPNRDENKADIGRQSPRNGANGSVQVISETFQESSANDDEAPNEASGDGGEDEPKIVVLPCLPAIKNPPPEKPDSSRFTAGSKYVLLYGVYLLSFPWVCAFTWTVPKCDTPRRRKWYLASFFACIIWIALLSWIMIELVEKIGCLLNIDTYTMGLVVVAVGTSVPDAISSVLVAKEGYGDMAVSNALGSNVFDINLGLGLPFFLGSVITAKPISLMSPMQMCLFETLPLSIRIVPHVKFGLILLLVLVIAVAVFMFVRFRLTKQVTILFIVMYVVFMIYAFVQEKKCHSFFC